MPSATSVSVKLSQGELFEILPLKLILAQQGNQQNELDLILKPVFYFTVMRWEQSGRWRQQQSEKDKDVWVLERQADRKERGPQSTVSPSWQAPRQHSVAGGSQAVLQVGSLQLLPCESISKVTNKKVTRSVRREMTSARGMNDG